MSADPISQGMRRGAAVFGFLKAWKRNRKANKAEKRDQPPDATIEDFNSQPDEVSMDAVKGALRSRLIWLGLAQVVYGLVQLWADGMLTIESAGPVLGGAVTIWLRAVTKDSLADKAK
jgi:hypothetical protein